MTLMSLRQAVVWTTWAIIAALLLLASMVFNLFPDYASQHSWCAALGLAWRSCQGW